MVSQYQQVIRVEIENAVKIVQAIPGSELCAISQDNYVTSIKDMIGVRLPVGYTGSEAQKIIDKVLGKPIIRKPKLTGLHALLCPELVYTGFRVFSVDRVNTLCSVTETGSFTNPGSNPNKAAKKAQGLLPLTFHFCFTNPNKHYSFFIFQSSLDGLVYARWKDELDNRSCDYCLIWEAVQRFEKLIKSAN